MFSNGVPATISLKVFGSLGVKLVSFGHCLMFPLGVSLMGQSWVMIECSRKASSSISYDNPPVNASRMLLDHSF